MSDIIIPGAKINKNAQTHILERMTVMGERLKKCAEEVNIVLIDQPKIINDTLTAFVADANLLLTGLPGTGKTVLLKSLGEILGLEMKRIQFTPDQTPDDLTGSVVFDQKLGDFKFIEGPLFSDIILADEINRGPPKTQSALLEAMEEKQITVGKKTYSLGEHFHVVASRNPIEHEGTNPLPEAQLDRFLFDLVMGNVSKEASMEISNIRSSLSHEEYVAYMKTLGWTDEDINASIEKDDQLNFGRKAKKVLNRQELAECKTLAKMIQISPDAREAIARLVEVCRPENKHSEIKNYLLWGVPGSRPGIAFERAVKARCLVLGRTLATEEDVARLAIQILSPRMALSYNAKRDNISLVELIGTGVQHELGFKQSDLENVP